MHENVIQKEEPSPKSLDKNSYSNCKSMGNSNNIQTGNTKLTSSSGNTNGCKLDTRPIANNTVFLEAIPDNKSEIENENFDTKPEKRLILKNHGISSQIIDGDHSMHMLPYHLKVNSADINSETLDQHMPGVYLLFVCAFIQSVTLLSWRPYPLDFL